MLLAVGDDRAKIKGQRDRQLGRTKARKESLLSFFFSRRSPSFARPQLPKPWNRLGQPRIPHLTFYLESFTLQVLFISLIFSLASWIIFHFQMAVMLQIPRVFFIIIIIIIIIMCLLPRKCKCPRPGPNIGYKSQQIPPYSPVCPRGPPPGWPLISALDTQNV